MGGGGKGGGGGGGGNYSAQIAEMNAANAKALADQRTYYDKQHTDFLASEAEKTRIAEEQRQAAITAQEQTDLFDQYNTRVAQQSNAIANIDRQIATEQAQAKISGAEFAMTDEQRLQRISNELAKVRTSAEDAKIAEYATKYSDFAKNRGIDANFLIPVGQTSPTSSLVGVSNKAPSVSTASLASTLLTSLDDNKLGASTILGG